MITLIPNSVTQYLLISNESKYHANGVLNSLEGSYFMKNEMFDT